MKEILEKDPKKFMLNRDDPTHILNRKDHHGHTPLYIGARQGNLGVVELLLKEKADPFLKSIVIMFLFS